MEYQAEETENNELVPPMTVEDDPVELSETIAGYVSSEAEIAVSASSIVTDILDLRNSIPNQLSDEEKKDEVARMGLSLNDGDIAVSETIETNGKTDHFVDSVNSIENALTYDLPFGQVLPHERHPWTPSRQSTVSSMAGNSVGGDSNDDDAPTMELIGKGLSNLGMSPINASGNTDEKSVRSENTRPDPPSTILTTDMLHRGSIVPEMPMDVYMNDENSMTHNDPPGPPASVVENQLIASVDEVVAAAQALAKLSVDTMNAAEKVHEHESSEKNEVDPQCDLDRTALLAETPGAVTTRKFSNPNQEEPTIPSNQVEFRRPTSHVEAPKARSTLGADNLILLPRVDEHRYFTTDNAEATPALDVASLYGYGARSTGPSQMIGGRNPGNGRRKIKLRLQEEVRNPNSSIKRHIRSSSLLGTIRKSSTRMLRFGGSIRATAFDTDDLDSPLPVELYKTVDRGSVSICWFDGTSSLELQQHVRKSVLRKIQLINDAVVELDDLRIFDESFSPPEGSFHLINDVFRLYHNITHMFFLLDR
jgi:hypothetical protein